MSAHSHAPAPEQARDLACRVGETMFAVDTASKDTMGMELVSCEPGRAVIRMTVRELHLNVCSPWHQKIRIERHGVWRSRVGNKKVYI